MKGKFIALEGIDGCGKETQMFLIGKFIYQLDKYNNVIYTREPTNSLYGQQVRKLLREDKNPKEKADIYTDLFVQDRKFHISEIIIPNLEKGIHVLSDRYKLSTLAYQQTQGMPLDQLLKIHEGLLIPDLTLLFDLPAEVALKRRQATGTAKEVFEQIDFQEELRQKYLELPKYLKDENLKIISASKSIEETFEQIKPHLEALF